MAEGTVALVRIDDWEGLYVNGELKEETHSIQNEVLFHYMREAGMLEGVTVIDRFSDALDGAYNQWPDSWLGRFPQHYDEITAYEASLSE